jgi:YVTN family beta-propeller protein
MKPLLLTVLGVALLLIVSMAWTTAPAAAGASGLLLVANKGERALGLIDPQTNRQIAQVPVNGVTGHEVIASPDGRTAYVPIFGDSGVGKAGSDGRHLVAIDLASRTIKATLDFGNGVRPHCPMINPRDGLLYVTTELDQTVSVIDPATMKVVGTVPTGQPESHMLAITRDGKRGYTSNVGPGTVSVLDFESRKLLKVIQVSEYSQRISLSADDKYAFTSDQRNPRLAVINTSTNEVERWVTLPASGYGTAATSDGKWLVVAMPTANKVAIVDLTSFTMARTIDVPQAPQEVLIRPDNEIAYVSCDVMAKVVAIRLSDWSIAATIDAGKGADGLAWAAGASADPHPSGQ